MFKVNCITIMVCILVVVPQVNGATSLNYLGKVSGGSAFRTYYKDGRLYAGVGTSLWVYDATDVNLKRIIAKRDFRSLIMDIKVRDDGIIFVAANHDGLWALDGNYSRLPTLAHIKMGGDTVAVDLTFIPPDTIYLTDFHSVRILRFTGHSFEEINKFAENSPPGSYPAATDRRGQYIVVAKRHARLSDLYGVIELYRADTQPTLLDTIRNDSIWGVEDVRFADLRDDIVYVLGGSIDLSLSHGAFFALQISEDTLKVVARRVFDIDGGPAGAFSTVIRRLDSWNDILFVVTTASAIPGYNSLTPPTDLPVLDARQLPDTLIQLGHIQPGLWYFDVALRDSNTLAIASEWYGIRWMDISGLYQGDTLIDQENMISQWTTGGWGKKPVIYNDTLWLAWEGYGVGIFKILPTGQFRYLGSLLHPFATDVKIVDTLAFVALASYGLGIFNLRPWFEGASPDTIDIKYSNIRRLAMLETNVGKRLVFQQSKNGFYLFDPQTLTKKGHFFYQWLVVKSLMGDMIGSGDTLFTAYVQKFSLSPKYTYLAALRVISDALDTIAVDTIDSPSNWQVCKMSRDGNLFAISYKSDSVFSIYSFDGTKFTLLVSDTLHYGAGIEDIYIKNGYVYVAEGPDGLEVYQYQYPSSLTLQYRFSGSGGAQQPYPDNGYVSQGGATGVTLGSDGKIYVSDFHAGLFILGAITDNIIAGDVNGDGLVDTYDINFLTNYLYYSGPSPVPYERGDVNGDCEVTGEDVSYLSRFLFQGGSSPVLCVKKR